MVTKGRGFRLASSFCSLIFHIAFKMLNSNGFRSHVNPNFTFAVLACLVVKFCWNERGTTEALPSTELVWVWTGGCHCMNLETQPNLYVEQQPTKGAEQINIEQCEAQSVDLIVYKCRDSHIIGRNALARARPVACLVCTAFDLILTRTNVASHTYFNIYLVLQYWLKFHPLFIHFIILRLRFGEYPKETMCYYRKSCDKT